jgi:hypothetical protein
MPLEVDPSDEDALAVMAEREADFGRLLERAAMRLVRKGVASPTGFEPVFWP